MSESAVAVATRDGVDEDLGRSTPMTTIRLRPPGLH